MSVSWRSRDDLVHQAIMLARDGLSRRAISRALGVSRNTIRTILAEHQVNRDTIHSAVIPRPPRAPRATLLDVWKPRVVSLITEFSDITAQRVFEILLSELPWRIQHCQEACPQGPAKAPAQAESGDAVLRPWRDG